MKEITVSDLSVIHVEDIQNLLKDKSTKVNVVYHKQRKHVATISKKLHYSLKVKDCEDMVFHTWQHASKLTMDKPIRVMYGNKKSPDKKFGFYFY